MLHPRSANNPRGFIWFRPGQVSMLLRRKEGIADRAPRLGEEEIKRFEAALREDNRLRGDHPIFNPDPWVLARNERGVGEELHRPSVLMQRGRDSGVFELQTGNLFGWTPDVNLTGDTSRLSDLIFNVCAVVDAANDRIRAGGPIDLGDDSNYLVEACSPNWLASVF